MTKIKKLSISILSVLIVLLLVATMVTPRAEATDKFLGHKVKKTVKLSFQMNYAFSDLSRDGMAGSCAQWNSGAGYDISILSTTKSYKTGYDNGRGDGKNTVYRETRDGYIPGLSKVATATDPKTQKEYVIEGDIVINMNCNFANSTTPQSGHYDTQTVLVHELGHIFGLAHPSDGYSQSTVMLAGNPGTSKRYITSSDRAAIKAVLIN